MGLWRRQRNLLKTSLAGNALLDRLKQIADETMLLLKEVGKLAEQFVVPHGILTQDIDRLTNEVLASWHGEIAV